MNVMDNKAMETIVDFIASKEYGRFTIGHSTEMAVWEVRIIWHENDERYVLHTPALDFSTAINETASKINVLLAKEAVKK